MELPALRADQALGFLAAIGVSALGEQGEIPEVRLGWTADSSPRAVVEGAVSSLEALQEALCGAFARLVERGGAIPGLDAAFPIEKRGSGSDPMRVGPAVMARQFDAAETAWRDRGDPWMARWLIALCGQTVTRDKGDVWLTPFYAPTGQMAMRTSIFDKTMQKVEEVDGPADALVAWRRTSFDAANFEERAKRDAGVTTWGSADNQGAPSPTWLAAMGMRYFPLSERTASLDAVGWQPVALYPGYTKRSLVWPAWSELLEPAAVRVLLAHPALRLGADQKPRRPNMLAGLGVTALFGSSRRTLSQGDGPLGPARRLWTASER